MRKLAFEALLSTQLKLRKKIQQRRTAFQLRELIARQAESEKHDAESLPHSRLLGSFKPR